jgi:UDP-2,3-diacylglucosamine hydrolase
MSEFLLSDLHLEAGKPGLTDIFVRFMRSPAARQAGGIYLLGDIFEVWIGDDDPSPLVARIAGEIRAVVDAGVPVYFMHGNRDFLVGQDYLRKAGMTLLDDPSLVTLGGVPTVLGHGDLYCTDDLAYQAFRAKSRDPAWQGKVLGWPLWRRRLTARLARYLSKRNYRKKLKQGLDPTAIADVSPAAVLAEFDRHGATRMIHGHTHRPARHGYPHDAGERERIVLADWRETGEALEVLPDGSWKRHTLR